MTKEEKAHLEDFVARVFTFAFELGTALDELHRELRQMRFETEDKDLQSALINLEHAFFMTAQSINILKEQARNAIIPTRKAPRKPSK